MARLIVAGRRCVDTVPPAVRQVARSQRDATRCLREPCPRAPGPASRARRSSLYVGLAVVNHHHARWGGLHASRRSERVRSRYGVSISSPGPTGRVVVVVVTRVVVVVAGRVVAEVAGGGATAGAGVEMTGAGAAAVVVVAIERSRRDRGRVSSTPGAAVVGVVGTGTAAGGDVVDVVDVDDELAVASSVPSASTSLEPALPTEDTRQTPTATSATTVTTMRPLRSRSSGVRWRSRRRSSRMADKSPSRPGELPLRCGLRKGRNVARRSPIALDVPAW